jgi:carbon monoxide dehydrogenase subunit G
MAEGSGLEFSGFEIVKAGPAQAYAFLINPDALKGCIPDLVSAEKASETTLKGVVKPGFSFIRSTLKFTMEITQTVPGKEALMKTVSTGIGMSMTVASTMKVTPEGSGSRIDWSAAVTERKGLVAAAPVGLLKGAADTTVRDSWNRIKAALDA